MTSIAKILIFTGLALVAAGLLLALAARIPGLNRLGHLPGDLHLNSGRVRVYFPWVSCLLLSLLLTLIMHLVSKFRS